MLTFHKAKNRSFPKGLTHGFGKKNSKKLYLIFLKISLKKECVHVSKQKRNLFRPQNGIFL